MICLTAHWRLEGTVNKVVVDVPNSVGAHNIFGKTSPLAIKN
jgi:hypothetical protein